MKHIRKIVLIVLSLVMALAVGVFFIGCDKDEILTPTKTLTAPTQVRVEGNYLCWNPVEFAAKYTVSIDGNEYYCEDIMYPVPEDIKDGVHAFKVKANGDGIAYSSSAYSETITAEFTDGGLTSSDYYGQFDELTKNESYLGYGFDIINSSVFSDKYVKTSFPIFNTEELLKQRLVKVDSKWSYVQEIQSSSMETFIEDWNTKANVNVSWGGKKMGGSVDVAAKYSGGYENAKSKYFHAIIFNNQKFYIVMQSDIKTYRNIVRDSFKEDLYSDLEPAAFFDRYGTHFITSAVMGGKIISTYLYTSEEEKKYHDISASVSVEVRSYKTNVDVGVSGQYRQEAKTMNIDIKNTLEVLGGGDYGMADDTDIPRHYADWEKSLNDHASLIGIKDTGSLIPIWELIDSTLDTRTYTWNDENGNTVTGSRAQQLQAYFMRYGIDEYNELMKASGLPELVVPEIIEDVRINGQTETNGEFEVYAGTDNDIAFKVLPDNAVGYTKNASLSQENEYARINNENGLKLQIDASAPHNEVFNLVLSAGAIRKQITVRIRKTYIVDFESNLGSEVPALRNVKHGSQIMEPATPTREGYEFKGWYTDPNFVAGTEYKFGEQAVIDNFTLYARWAVYMPKIRFVHEVAGCNLVEDSVKYNNVYAQPQTPTIDGYTFGGWYEDIEMLIPFDFTQPIKKETYIYVKWYKNPKITFIHSVDGCSMLSDSVAYNGVYSRPVIPELAGYSFGGYYANKDMTEEYDFAQNITKDQTIYVKWQAKIYTVKFNTNGGTVVEEQKIEYNSKATEPTVTKTGSSLEGWYLDSAFTKFFNFSIDVVTEDITLYAKWGENLYTVTFDVDGGNDIDSVQVSYGTAIGNKLPSIATKTGYAFAGWYLESDYQTKATSETVIEKNITLYAKFMICESQIRYMITSCKTINSQELKGDFAIKNLGVDIVSYNIQRINIANSTTYSDYYNFVGWCLTEEYDPNKMITDGSGALLHNVNGYTNEEGKWICSSEPIINLFAQWEQKYKDYTYIENSGDLLSIQKEGKYKLISDIDFLSSKFSSALVESFSGELDGNGKTIKNILISLNIYSAFNENINIALFANTTEESYIHDLNIENFSIEMFTPMHEGAGWIHAGTISALGDGVIENINVYDSQIEIHRGASCFGGIAGSYKGIIRNCHVQGIKLSGNGDCGGIVGNLDGSKSSAENCSVTKSSTRRSYIWHYAADWKSVGGICGYGSSSVIRNCHVSSTDFTLDGGECDDGTKIGYIVGNQVGGRIENITYNELTQNCSVPYGEGHCFAAYDGCGGLIDSGAIFIPKT